MTSEMQKLIAGENYRPGDPELVEARARAKELMALYNATTVSDGEKRGLILDKLLGGRGKDAPSARPYTSTMAPTSFSATTSSSTMAAPSSTFAL